MPIKTLIQTQEQSKLYVDEEPKEKTEITWLLTAEYLRQLLDTLAKSEDKHVVTDLPTYAHGLQCTLEIYEPGKARKLQYTKNLERNDWKTESVSSL